MKKCPFCAEEIQDEAVKCKHCGEFLSGKNQSKPKEPWYARTSVIVIVLLSIPPLALPLVWLNPRWNIYFKIAFSVAVLLLTWWMWVSWLWIVQAYKQALHMVSGMGITM